MSDEKVLYHLQASLTRSCLPLCFSLLCLSTLKFNCNSLSRMSTIFWLLISISSLHGPFISLGTQLKGRPRLPWLISSQPHRSQAFPTQCSLCSHKDPRNPAACPQLIFPVATLLTQPPTGNGCKCRTRNRLLCMYTLPCLAHSGTAKVSITLGGWNLCPQSVTRGFQAPLIPLIKQHKPSHQSPASPFLSPSGFLCLMPRFCFSWNISLTFGLEKEYFWFAKDSNPFGLKSA